MYLDIFLMDECNYYSYIKLCIYITYVSSGLTLILIFCDDSIFGDKGIDSKRSVFLQIVNGNEPQARIIVYNLNLETEIIVCQGYSAGN